MLVAKLNWPFWETPATHCSPFTAADMSLVSIERVLLFALSFLPLSCLMLDHLECPDQAGAERDKHRTPKAGGGSEQRNARLRGADSASDDFI